MTVALTVVKSGSHIGKEFSTPDGQTITKAVLGQLYSGVATTREITGSTAGEILEQYGKLCAAQPPDTVNLLGTAANGKKVNELTKAKARHSADRPHAIPRTKEYFAYQGDLSLLLIDHDGGSKKHKKSFGTCIRR